MERTGIRRFFLMESIFFPFAFRMVSALSPTRPPACRASGCAPPHTGGQDGQPGGQGAAKLFLPNYKREAEEKVLRADPLTAWL
ncbi:hypothetical protein ASL14_26355 (plasmid) [Paenibacillus sp. IHB B 3084]|nr:hypothetical protein ASL14_26355 [Paenibacillus sp. IHB B 3084]